VQDWLRHDYASCEGGGPLSNPPQNAPGESDMSDQLEREIERAKRQEYWRTRKQVTGVIPRDEFNELEPTATPLKMTVGRLIIAQSRAYRTQEFIPPLEMIERLDEIRFLIRSIANGHNQQTRLSNTWKKLSAQRQITKMLRTLETEAFQMIRKPWSVCPICKNQGGPDDPR